jgi:hypothetical protein
VRGSLPDRLAGLAVFLPVPIVILLFTRAPLGIAASLVLGVAIMVTHRLYARPFARARAGRRCLWCGGEAADGPTLLIEDPLGAATWRACSPSHADRVRRFFGWTEAHRWFLRAGLLGTLAAFLVALGGIAVRGAGPDAYADAVHAFRLAVALTVLPLALFYGRRPPPDTPPRAPFPVHLQALLGAGAVVWLFRIIGAAWLVLAVLHFAGRI